MISNTHTLKSMVRAIDIYRDRESRVSGKREGNEMGFAGTRREELIIRYYS